MHLFIAALLTETNTFSPCPTGRRAFEESGVFQGDASSRPDESLFGPLMQLWRGMGEQLGWSVTESLCTFAQPGGVTPTSVYEDFKSGILSDLDAAGTPDIVLLALHGAMVATDIEDCEGDLCTAIKTLCGPETTIGAVIDSHCHQSAAMLDSIDLLIAYKEYPHTDVGERAVELFELGRRAAAGDISPVTRAVDCQMVALWRTRQAPGNEIVETLYEIESRPGVLSASFGHGFPWADVADVGARCWVITDGDAELAASCAEEVGSTVIDTRELVRPDYHTVESAIAAVASAPPGLVVMADVADNPGGGSMSDSTFVLRGLVDHGVGNTVVGLFWDPGALDICLNAGEGAELDLRLGGKCGPESGNPVDLRCKVRVIRDQHAQTGLSGSIDQVGTAIWLESAGIDIVLSSIRSQVFSPDIFTGLGIELSSRRLVVVKSTEHFAAAFADIASQLLYVDTPGALNQDFAKLPYTRRDGTYWPRIDTPSLTEFPAGQKDRAAS